MATVISEEITPSSYWLMRSWCDMHESFLKSRKPADYLVNRHVDYLLKVEEDSEAVVRDRIKQYYNGATKAKVKEDLNRVIRWLQKPLHPCQIHGAC